MKGSQICTVRAERNVTHEYAMVMEGNCQINSMTQCWKAGVRLYRSIVRCRRITSTSARLRSRSSFAGKSSRIDFAWMEEMMAQIAQSRQLTKSAFAIQRASEVLDHGIPANAAPAQKLAYHDQ